MESTFDDKDKVFDQSDIILDIGNDTITYSSPSGFVEAIEIHGLKEYMDSVKAESAFEKLLVTQAYKVAQNKGKGLFAEYLSNVSILMFFLLPFFALLLKLFFKKQKHYYNEHLIFTFHLHAFIFLLLSVYSLVASYITKSYSFLFVIIAVFLYSIIAVKKVYKYSYKSSIGRLVLLLSTYNIILVFGLVLIMFISFALY